MKSPELSLLTEYDNLDIELQEPEAETPTLPIKVFTDQQEFERQVYLLRKVHEANKPVGVFF